jgi:hypothetical protein
MALGMGTYDPATLSRAQAASGFRAATAARARLASAGQPGRYQMAIIKDNKLFTLNLLGGTGCTGGSQPHFVVHPRG